MKYIERERFYYMSHVLEMHRFKSILHTFPTKDRGQMIYLELSPKSTKM